MSKELYIAAHERLINEYLDEHEYADWSKAYEVTADMAFQHMQEMYADQIDAERMKRKEAM